MAMPLLPESRVQERSPHWFDPVYAGWTHVLHPRSVVPLLSMEEHVFCGEGHTKHINDMSGKGLSLTGLARGLGYFAEMNKRIL